MLLNTDTVTRNKALEKVLHAQLETPIKDFVKKYDLDWPTYKRYTSDARIQTNRIEGYLRILLKLGAKITATAVVPGFPSASARFNMTESVDEMGMWLARVAREWIEHTGTTAQGLAISMGKTPGYFTSAVSATSYVVALSTCIDRLGELGFTVHMDVVIDGEHVIPPTVDKHVNKKLPAVTEKFVPLSDHRRSQLSSCVRRIMRAAHGTIDKTAANIGIAKSTVAKGCNPNNRQAMSVEFYASILLAMKASVQYEAISGFESMGTLVYAAGGDRHETAKWVSDVVKETVKLRKETYVDQAKKYGLDYARLKRYLVATPKANVHATSSMGYCSGLGIIFRMRITHPALQSDILIDLADPEFMTEEGKKKVETELIMDVGVALKEKQNTDSFVYLASDEHISNMCRGKVKTSLGETVRAFL